MEKFEKYNPDEETIEAWLKSFEIWLLCHNITGADCKCNWCRSLVGEAGNLIIEKLTQAATWPEIKEELCSVLGENDTKGRAFENLLSYKPKGKDFGEIATDIMAKAAIATYDTDLQTQLGLKVFLQAVPRNIGQKLRRMHFNSVKEALKEARFLQSIEKDENCRSWKIFSVEAEPLEKGLKVEITQIVEACLRQMQAQQPQKEQSERPRMPQKELWCWYCGEMGNIMRGCPVIQQDETAACKQKTGKMMPEGAKGFQRVSDGAKGCQMALQRARECQNGPDGAKGCQMVPEGGKGCQMTLQRARECQNGPDGANGCQMVPEGGKGRQKDQIGTVVAPGLGKTSDLIFVMVSIAGVEVVALVGTGATTSCCRWEWYQRWKEHLGAMIKSKVRIMGVGPDPIKIKGLTRPLTLHWDGVGGKFQLMILTALTDVDIVLGMDVLSQFDVKINFKKQLASPTREPSTPLEQEKNVGLLLDDPGFTFKGKNPVKEEGVEEVAKNVLRPCYREIHRVWMASARPVKARRKRKDRKIDRKSSMPWDKAVYKAQLGKDLQDIQDKLSRILGRKLVKNDRSFVEETSPVKCIEGGVLVDLCMQRSGKRGSGCDVPNKDEKLPRSADGSLGASKGFPTPLTSSLMAPKPPRTKVREYAWRKNEICMFIRLLKPSESKKEKANHREGGEVTASHLSYEKAMTLLSRYKKAMTPLSLSRQKAKGENRRDSVYIHRRKLVTVKIIPIYQCKTSMHSVKPSESRKEQKESQFKLPGASHHHQTCDVMDDGINRDGRRRTIVNRLVARKLYAASEHSSSHLKDHNSSLTISKQFLVQLAFIFIMVINVIRSG